MYSRNVFETNCNWIPLSNKDPPVNNLDSS